MKTLAQQHLPPNTIHGFDVGGPEPLPTLKSIDGEHHGSGSMALLPVASNLGMTRFLTCSNSAITICTTGKGATFESLGKSMGLPKTGRRTTSSQGRCPKQIETRLGLLHVRGPLQLYPMPLYSITILGLIQYLGTQEQAWFPTAAC